VQLLKPVISANHEAAIGRITIPGKNFTRPPILTNGWAQKEERKVKQKIGRI
jgi:hypothetical protein